MYISIITRKWVHVTKHQIYFHIRIEYDLILTILKTMTSIWPFKLRILDFNRFHCTNPLGSLNYPVKKWNQVILEPVHITYPPPYKQKKKQNNFFFLNL